MLDQIVPNFFDLEKLYIYILTKQIKRENFLPSCWWRLKTIREESFDSGEERSYKKVHYLLGWMYIYVYIDIPLSKEKIKKYLLTFNQIQCLPLCFWQSKKLPHEFLNHAKIIPQVFKKSLKNPFKGQMVENDINTLYNQYLSIIFKTNKLEIKFGAK